MAKKIVKKVEIPMVQIEIEVSEEFYKRIQEGKKELKKIMDGNSMMVDILKSNG